VRAFTHHGDGGTMMHPGFVTKSKLKLTVLATKAQPAVD
jgi:hypothetical protein